MLDRSGQGRQGLAGAQQFPRPTAQNEPDLGGVVVSFGGHAPHGHGGKTQDASPALARAQGHGSFGEEGHAIGGHAPHADAAVSFGFKGHGYGLLQPQALGRVLAFGDGEQNP